MTTLYKYQDWTKEYVRKSFIESSLYFSNNLSFNDPFDLQLPVLLENTSALEYVIKEEQKHLNRELTESELAYIQAFVKNNQAIIGTKIEDLREIMSSANSENENTLGVLCMSMINNNTLMWGHYANKHSGICIGLDLKKLLEYLPHYTRSKVFYGDVNYTHDIPKMDYLRMENEDYWFNAYKERLRTKSLDWQYEQEVRILISNYSNRLVKLPNDVFTEVIFGCRLSTEEKKAIKRICQERHPHIKLFYAVPNNEIFKMDIKEYID